MCTSSLFPGDIIVQEAHYPPHLVPKVTFLCVCHFGHLSSFTVYGDPWPLIRMCRKDGNFKINLENQRNTCNFTRWLIEYNSILRNYDCSTDPSGRAIWAVGLRSPLVVIVVSNPAGARMSVTCECCVLSGRGLCDGLITECGVSEGDLEASIMKLSWGITARCAMEKVKHKLQHVEYWCI